MEKIPVINKVTHSVTVSSPELRFTRTWPAYNSVVKIDKEVLDDLMYDIGFSNMLKMGILYIEDMNIKKDLGLEPEEATEPQNIIVLSDKDKHYYLTQLSLVGFKDKISKLGKEQINELCNYAITNQLIDIEKAKVLKEACGRDIVAAIRLTEQNKEA